MNTKDIQYIESLIRTIPNFPSPNILFRDITTVLKDARGFHIIIDDFLQRYQHANIDYVLGAEARGFIVGAPLAYALDAGFVPARKPGKLPGDVIQASYELEYGHNTIEIHKNAFPPNANVLIIDDLLATGGTAKAMTSLVEQLNAHVYELAFTIELSECHGHEHLKPYPVYTQLVY